MLATDAALESAAGVGLTDLRTFQSSAGDVLSLALAGIGQDLGRGLTLTLLAPGGAPLAEGVAGALNADAVLSGVISEGGTYHVQIAGGQGQGYQLAVGRDVEIEADHGAGASLTSGRPLLGGLAHEAPVRVATYGLEMSRRTATSAPRLPKRLLRKQVLAPKRIVIGAR